jgi:hypothetical protein
VENKKERYHLRVLDVVGRIILKCSSVMYGVRTLIGFIVLRVAASGRLV